MLIFCMQSSFGKTFSKTLMFDLLLKQYNLMIVANVIIGQGF